MMLIRAAMLAFALTAGIVSAHAQTNAATTNGSISITTGNTFQQALAALGVSPANRRSLTIENNNTNGDNC
jgi:hypothetical protein